MTTDCDKDTGLAKPTTIPRFRRGVKLRFDPSREAWVLLAPERAFLPDAIATEILRLVDGARTASMIAATLAERFAAPIAVIEADVATVLADLAARGALEP